MIKKITEQIRVKGGEVIDFEIGYTHRGPILELDLLKQGAELLFVKGSPKLERSPYYSLGWAAAIMPSDQSMAVIELLATAESVKKTFTALDEMGKDGFSGFAQNIMMADMDGDIAYFLMSPIPVRKDKTPYLGCRVLDGRRSDFDWEPNRLAPVTELPRSLNPKKGYLVSANNR